MDEPPKRRGRPRTLDRNVGLGVAARLFWEHGYEGTSIADLTAAMGVTPPSLYATFGSKEELYNQALDHAVERESKARTDALHSDMSAYEALSFYLHDVVTGISRPDDPRGCIVSTAVVQCAAENETVAKSVAARRESAIKALRDRFDRAVNEGELAAGTDTDSLARFYGAFVQGMSVQACDGACTERLRRLVDIALSAWPGKHGDGVR
ncbi:TetR/AcrR family transcriptional regulator [Mesorhizobium sp. ASY16-5R]|uniref:TetR/AcrR family transcriptional regulator n=1 Tax=Mesorhizobium sp. ASY16-5R TaxID=3445772 RepID=UPI003F9FC230